MEREERLPIPLEWEEPKEPGLAEDLLDWFVMTVRDLGRCGVSPAGCGSGNGAVARVIRLWRPLGLEFLEDKEDGLDGERLNELWVEGLEEPEPWSWEGDRERRNLVERAEMSEELLRERLISGRSVEVLPVLQLRLGGVDTRLETTLGNDATGSEDG